MITSRIPRSALVALAMAGPALFGQTIHVPGGTVGNISGSNVGIGTATPAQKLEVNGRARVGDGTNAIEIVGGSSGGLTGGHLGTVNSVPLAFYTGYGGPQMVLSTAGNVGIGTDSPVQRLEVNKPGNAVVAIRQPDAPAPGKYVQMTLSHGPTYYGASDRSWQVVSNGMSNGEADLVLQYWNGSTFSESTRFAATGRIGMGTTTPATRLHVDDGDLLISDLGTGEVAQLILDSNSGAGDLVFLRQGALKFLLRAHVDTSGGTLEFADRSTGSHLTRLYIAGNGNVGIGIASPSHKLAVNGTIKAKEVIVETTGWADHVFADDYRLAPLEEVEAHIRAKRHLPGIPSAATVAERGISLGEMQAKLLEKIEELTLHVIELKKENHELRGHVQELQRSNLR